MASERMRKQLAAAGINREPLLFGEAVRTVAEASAALGVEEGQIAKSIVFQSGDRFGVFVAAGDNRISNRKVRKIMGGKSVRIALPETVLEVTGYEIGAVTPLGLLQALPIFIDETLARFAQLYAGGGSKQSLLPLDYQELLRLTGGAAVDLKADA